MLQGCSRGENVLQGPVVPGSTIDEVRSIDVLNHKGDIEVRVWVYVERQFVPNLQQNTWSRAGNSFSSNPLGIESPRDGTTRSSGRWTPVGRDEKMEQRLLAQMESSLQSKHASK